MFIDTSYIDLSQSRHIGPTENAHEGEFAFKIIVTSVHRKWFFHHNSMYQGPS
jgi:hypothetical protein